MCVLPLQLINILVEHGLLTKRIYVSPSSYYRDIFEIENLYSHSTLYLYVIVVSLIIQ